MGKSTINGHVQFNSYVNLPEGSFDIFGTFPGVADFSPDPLAAAQFVSPIGGAPFMAQDHQLNTGTRWN